MLVLFGVALSNKPANVPWAVLDRSDDPSSRRLIADIQATGYFLPPAPITSYEHARHLLRRGKTLAVLVVPDDFLREVERGRAQVQLLLDGSDPLSAARIRAYISSVAAGIQPRDEPRRGRRAAGID